jgi:hypothetical protein
MLFTYETLKGSGLKVVIPFREVTCTVQIKRGRMKM